MDQPRRCDFCQSSNFYLRYFPHFDKYFCNRSICMIAHLKPEQYNTTVYRDTVTNPGPLGWLKCSFCLRRIQFNTAYRIIVPWMPKSKLFKDKSFCGIEQCCKVYYSNVMDRDISHPRKNDGVCPVHFKDDGPDIVFETWRFDMDTDWKIY